MPYKDPEELKANRREYYQANKDKWKKDDDREPLPSSPLELERAAYRAKIADFRARRAWSEMRRWKAKNPPP